MGGTWARETADCHALATFKIADSAELLRPKSEIQGIGHVIAHALTGMVELHVSDI